MMVLQSTYSCAVSRTRTFTWIQMPNMNGGFTSIIYNYIEIRILGIFSEVPWDCAQYRGTIVCCFELTFIVWTFNSVFVPRVLGFFLNGPLNLLHVFGNECWYLMNQRWWNNGIICIVLWINQRYFSSKRIQKKYLVPKCRKLILKNL